MQVKISLPISPLTDIDIMGGTDDLQSGYLPNHKMDPAVVDSTNFGGSVPGSGVTEQFLAKPLVYTPSEGPQVVIAASETNWVYVLNAATGTIINKRKVRDPFDVADLPCTDIRGTVGITGTPIIKRETNTLYFYAKGYKDTVKGVFNGAFLQAPDKYFHGGTHLQRTSLIIKGNTVYAAFGGVCEQYNFTGYIVGTDIGTPKINAIWTTVSGPDSIAQDGTWHGGGGEAGIWQSGRSMASDGADRFFVATGNGKLLGSYSSAVPGPTPPKNLEGSVVSIKVNMTTGELTPQDHFRPYDYVNIDPDLRDIGAGGVTILDPASFSAATAPIIGIVGGKTGKMYVLNMNNMGGFKNGNGGTDAVIQTIVMPTIGSAPGGLYGTVASYPLPGVQGGGYIYAKMISTAGTASPICVYKFNPDGTLTDVARSDNTASHIGTGIPTVTSFDGAAGTGILWFTTRDGDLNAYRAIPVNGVLQRINLPTSGIKSAKFQRPAFGNGRVYVSTSDGNIVCFGKKP
ncbi:uncharacterized protein LAJ45_01621 [Morchella importuna]|uniref:uncharacterized protein n=1 Tax=Morchella importuna TaxID=1174673 RepID=UPI001E8CB204|nr:uncharacterized protein LAJ45_01621 [Morchella importuna]KAH8153854.1 hypothetical protein LAJ45_01621 [Morchella importuna]